MSVPVNSPNWTAVSFSKKLTRFYGSNVVVALRFQSTTQGMDGPVT